MTEDREGIDVLIARAGYTGEDGFEIIADATKAVPLWELFLEHGVGACHRSYSTSDSSVVASLLMPSPSFPTRSAISFRHLP